MTETNAPEDINVTCAEAKFCIVHAGSFPDEKTGELIEYEDSIKIKIGKFEQKLSPYALAAIVRATQHKDIKPILTKRLAQQKEEMAQLGF